MSLFEQLIAAMARDMNDGLWDDRYHAHQLTAHMLGLEWDRCVDAAIAKAEGK